MQFGLSTEQTLMQNSVHSFLGDRIPLARVRSFTSGDLSAEVLWTELAELGIPGLLIPESCGGVGFSCLDAAVVAEQLGYHATPAPFIGSAVMAPLALIAAGGHTELLAALATGKRRVGIAFSEAIGKRADAGITVSSKKLTGKCLFVLDDCADTYLIASSDQHLYLLAANASGLQRRTLASVDKTQSFCELVLHNVTAELLSDDPTVFTHALNAGRVMLAADTLGAAQAMLDQAVAYAKQREQFNRVIASFQAVKHMCADMAANLEPCRSFVWYAGHALDHAPDERHLLACQVKAHVSEVARQIAKTATEVHGGMGFTDLLGLHYWFKRIAANHQLLGAPELLREEAARAQGLVD